MSDTAARYVIRFDIELLATSPERAAVAARDILLGTDTRVIADVFPFEYIEAAEDWFHTEDRGWWVEFREGTARPYHIVEKCAGDAGYLATHRQRDPEVWLPGSGEFMEVMTDTNTSDYQARRLNIRYRGEGGKPRFVHMLNGTAITSSRTLLALIEYGQRADGSIATPEPLHAFGAPALIPAAT